MLSLRQPKLLRVPLPRQPQVPKPPRQPPKQVRLHLRPKVRLPAKPLQRQKLLQQKHPLRSKQLALFEVQRPTSVGRSAFVVGSCCPALSFGFMLKFMQ